ncbi:hypothetical protein SUDANB121_00944 [Nocardiopsis dassonvillei]|uniref:VOC family protein n=1 Tax=Nocardiopsis dassonvillei TaxID=2014 RepID=UPI003F5784F6
MRPTSVTLDCAAPLEPAAFHGRATGLSLGALSTAGFAALAPENGFALVFRRVGGYRPPHRPVQEVFQQVHLGLGVDDLDAAQAELPDLGATAPAEEPNAERWRMPLDPAGHPFCWARR